VAREVEGERQVAFAVESLNDLVPPTGATAEAVQQDEALRHARIL
jgi:hypothetical protein